MRCAFLPFIHGIAALPQPASGRPHLALALILGLALAACATVGSQPRQVHENETFATDTPFVHYSSQALAAACETGKRALLSQGYQVEDNKPTNLRGEKRFRPGKEKVAKLSINLVCLPSKHGAVIYANALETYYGLKSRGSNAGLSVAGMGSLSLPWTIDRDTLVKTGEETVTHAGFYRRLFELIESLKSEKNNAPAANDAS